MTAGLVIPATEGRTGRWRFRTVTRLFGEPFLVLQVEHGYASVDPAGGQIDIRHGVRWVDATPGDLLPSGDSGEIAETRLRALVAPCDLDMNSGITFCRTCGQEWDYGLPRPACRAAGEKAR